MKRIFNILMIPVMILATVSLVNAGNSPYPIIFVHGLNSDNMTWNSTLNVIGQTWEMSDDNVLHAVLNARGGDTTLFTEDVLFPLLDLSGNTVNLIAPSNIYTANFGNFWNRDAQDPRILLYNNSLPGSNQSPGNQSAITKQGFALKIIIDSVLRVTQSEKVILVGHSMGGLAIREYLQRRENGVPKWWIDPLDTVAGHRVAKVVTTGTPHLGTNVNSIPILNIDNNSEAMRDMRYTYTNGETAVYLFTNNESTVTSNYYNSDINCNGTRNEIVAGISSGNSFNSMMPLPHNLTYTYIVSNYLGLGTDLAVPTTRQWLRTGNTPSPAGVADTLFNRRNHLQQTSDFESIIRGLDEPDRKEFAYDLDFGIQYSSFITLQSGGTSSDSDYYAVSALTGGLLKAIVSEDSAGVNGIAILDSSGVMLTQETFSGDADSVLYKGPAGKYFLRITGNSLQNTSLNSHNLAISFTPDLRLELTMSIEAMWDGTLHVNDTVTVYLRKDSFPYNIMDSARGVLNSNGLVSSTFPNATPGDYFIQVYHRNSLETWSAVAETFVNEAPLVYDFTSDASKAFGSNMALRNSRYCFFSGDVDNDGSVDATDVAMIDNHAQSFASGYLDTDLDGNHFVDGTDFAVADNNASQFVTVIRP